MIDPADRPALDLLGYVVFFCLLATVVLGLLSWVDVVPGSASAVPLGIATGVVVTTSFLRGFRRARSGDAPR